MKSAIHGGQNVVATFQVSWFGKTNNKNQSAAQDVSITLSPPWNLARLEIPFESKFKLFVHHKSPMLSNKLSQGTRRKWQCIYKKTLVLQYQTNAVSRSLFENREFAEVRQWHFRFVTTCFVTAATQSKNQRSSKELFIENGDAKCESPMFVSYVLKFHLPLKNLKPTLTNCLLV